MAGIPEDQVFELNAVRLGLDPSEHPWCVSEAAAIAANWAREQVERPFLFNGTVMMHRGLELADGVISGASHRVSYAALLHMINHQPMTDAWHLFGSAIILSSDNAVLLIRMAAKTANAGKVYAPSGSLDEHDIVSNRVDVDASMVRESFEETGIDLTRAAAEDRLFGWRSGRRVAVFRRFRCAESADVLADRIDAHARSTADQEIDGAVIVRKPVDAGPTAPPYMQALLNFHFAEGVGDNGWQRAGNG